jgi:hypothetical protein
MRITTLFGGICGVRDNNIFIVFDVLLIIATNANNLKINFKLVGGLN